jgi:hypothetical protein
VDLVWKAVRAPALELTVTIKLNLSPGIVRGLSNAEIQQRSVLRDDWRIEAIVQAHADDIAQLLIKDPYIAVAKTALEKTKEILTAV